MIFKKSLRKQWGLFKINGQHWSTLFCAQILCSHLLERSCKRCRKWLALLTEKGYILAAFYRQKIPLYIQKSNFFFTLTKIMLKYCLVRNLTFSFAKQSLQPNISNYSCIILCTRKRREVCINWIQRIFFGYLFTTFHPKFLFIHDNWIHNDILIQFDIFQGVFLPVHEGAWLYIKESKKKYIRWSIPTL